MRTESTSFSFVNRLTVTDRSDSIALSMSARIPVIAAATGHTRHAKRRSRDGPRSSESDRNGHAARWRAAEQHAAGTQP